MPKRATPISHRGAPRRAAIPSLRRIGCASALVMLVVGCSSSHPSVERSSRPTASETTVRTTTSSTYIPNLVVGAPTSFVSTRGLSYTHGGVVVAVSSARTGVILERLLSVPSTSYVSGTAITRTGDVLVTTDHGPKFINDGQDGDPQPHTCGSTVHQIDPRTGTIRTVLRGTDNELISDVQPSPTGNRIAYIESACVTDFNFPIDSLKVKDLTTGHVSTVGPVDSRCHSFSNPRWTSDGSNLVFVYDKRGGSPLTAPQSNGCAQLTVAEGAAQLAVVAVGRSGLSAPVRPVPADPGCSVSAVAATSDGYAAVEACGVKDLYLYGPVRLVRYNETLQPVSRARLGPCQNGVWMAGDLKSNAVVVAVDQDCDANGGRVTKVLADTGHGPRQLLVLTGGEPAVTNISY